MKLLAAGWEHGTGVYVTEVTPSSEAERQGLLVSLITSLSLPLFFLFVSPCSGLSIDISIYINQSTECRKESHIDLPIFFLLSLQQIDTFVSSHGRRKETEFSFHIYSLLQ